MPGAEFAMERSLAGSLTGDEGLNKSWSVAAEGTKAANSSNSLVVSQSRGPKDSVKKEVASSMVPSKPGLSSPKTWRAARFLEIR